MPRGRRTLLALFLLTLGHHAHSRRPSRGGGLVGLWAADTTFGPAARGPVTVRRLGDEWRATVAGMVATFHARRDSIRFALPNAQGAFRGVLSADGRAITGFWIQPAGVALGEAFAAPLTLRRDANGLWSGTLVPLGDRFTLYLEITRDSIGTLVGVFRNPQLNSRGGASRFAVRLDGDSVRITAPPDAGRPAVRITAAFDSTTRRIYLPWADIGRTLVLTPSTPTLTAAFNPRPLGAAPYRYRVPAREADGWATASARSVGMDEGVLTGLVRRLADSDPAAPRAMLIHSLLIARRGKLVLDEYFYGYDRHRVHDLRSASKTFASVLVGVAQAHGVPIGSETRIYDLLADAGPFDHPDSRKREITVGELMTHTSGLACDDNDDESPGNEDRMQSQRAQPDWWKYTMDLPMAHDPGTHYAYCSAGMNLVGAALTAATRTWLPALFDRWVARPLGFGPYYFNLMPTGEGYAGGGVHLRPRDLLKLGQAYLDGGRWRGRQVVPAAWVERSTQLQSDSTGATDGFAWHLNVLHAGGHDYREFEANGNGGQFLIVVPELDLAVVFTAGNYGQYGIWRRFRDDLVPEAIISAIHGRPSSPADLR